MMGPLGDQWVEGELGPLGDHDGGHNDGEGKECCHCHKFRWDQQL